MRNIYCRTKSVCDICGLELVGASFKSERDAILNLLMKEELHKQQHVIMLYDKLYQKFLKII